MKDVEFDTRLDRVKRATDVIKHLPSETLQTEALRYLLGNGAGEGAEERADGTTDDAAQTKDNGSGKAAKKPAVRRAKPATVNPDKSLELAPSGKQSWDDFVAAKSPSNHHERYTAAVYWIREIAENDKATINQIVTCYHAQGWALPSDVRNQASQTGMKYLDSSSLDDLKLSTLGVNLVNALPKSAKK